MGASFSCSLEKTVQISSDGFTRTSRNSSPGSWQSVTYGNDLFVALGLVAVVHTSPDGVTWTSRRSAADGQWSSLTYGAGLFVAVYYNGFVQTSPDGIAWMSFARRRHASSGRAAFSARAPCPVSFRAKKAPKAVQGSRGGV